MQVKKQTGDAAEKLAAEFLQRHGLRVLERNWRVRGGEIDLICEDRGCLVFVEVMLAPAPASRLQSSVASSSPRVIIWPASPSAPAASMPCCSAV